MRVVSGTCKGRVLKSVPGMTTRPTTDKVKEAIFNMIGPYFQGGTALDLFAGSGGLGIEALSRGMDRCIFIDKDKKAIQTIQTNLLSCNLKERAELFRTDAERALRAIVKRGLTFDLILLDPPYKQQILETILSFIEHHHLLNQEGAIVCEHRHDVHLPKEVGILHLKKQEIYGHTAVTIYRTDLNGWRNEIG
ncbi:16S rRNA (guanine(966)-N(2))-methyltransferase RsmD [Bacillus alveayuensis]|uniref:16S rRNA (guanine(966)-N(2))-methyltransferase RsmD n=1 Tax=Aeribacillus alveayuensis TaxID=279215 RepID=UPI0005D0F2A2|nr:16S rRNA (guanine(966)-N(2))-methyltransferase RsmD [Bacillus alveayuensis]